MSESHASDGDSAVRARLGRNPRLYTLIGVLLISFSAIFVRLADVSPVTASFFRAAYALPILLALSVLFPRTSRPSRRERPFAIAAGLVFAADLALWHLGIHYIGAGLSTTLGNTQVAIVMIAGWVFLKERPTAIAVALLPVIFGGVVLISGLGTSDAYGADPGLGAIIGVVTAILYTAYLFLLRSASRGQDVPAVPLLEVTLGAAIGGLLFAPFDAGFSIVPTWPAHGWLFLLAVAAQVVAWLLIAHSLPLMQAWESSVLLVLQPAGTVLWAYLIFRESPSATQWIGVGCVVIGVTFASAWDKRPGVSRTSET